MNLSLGYCVAILLAPLCSGLIAGCWGKVLGRRWTHCICNAGVFLACLLSWYLWFQIQQSRFFRAELVLYTWANWNNYSIHVGFLVDKLTSVLLVIVTTISWLVHWYSIAYMHQDRSYQRFFSYIALFTFFMLLLVFSNNLLQMFMGWEGVGLMSYLLIGFWFEKDSALFASLKAFIVNRVADFAFVIGILGVFAVFKTLNFFDVFAQMSHNSEFTLQTLTWIGFALFIGAMGKSAQIPFHVWLPDSMEGPTPISALIHAATMVTAGIFMVIRMSPFYDQLPVMLDFMLIIGCVTCWSMGILGLVQSDIKKIIAYSTLSQLGFMVMGLGAQAYDCSLLHLVTHAFFKALLFLGAGSILLSLHHEQNIWQMRGRLGNALPMTRLAFLIGTLSLVGLPGLAGFFSKELLLEALHESVVSHAESSFYSWIYYFSVGSVLITSLYSFRLFFVIFGQKSDQTKIVESNWEIKGPLTILSVFSILGGILFTESIVDPGRLSLSISSMMAEGFLKMPFWLGGLGVLVSWFLYVRRPDLPIKIKNALPVLNKVLHLKYGFDALYEKFIMPLFKEMAQWCWRFLDQKTIDHTFIMGTAAQVPRSAALLSFLQSGLLSDYALALLLGGIILCLSLYFNFV